MCLGAETTKSRMSPLAAFSFPVMSSLKRANLVVHQQMWGSKQYPTTMFDTNTVLYPSADNGNGNGPVIAINSDLHVTGQADVVDQGYNHHDNSVDNHRDNPVEQFRSSRGI